MTGPSGVDGQRINSADDFLGVIESKQPGDKVTLGIIRDGREVAVPVQLEAGD